MGGVSQQEPTWAKKNTPGIVCGSYWWIMSNCRKKHNSLYTRNTNGGSNNLQITFILHHNKFDNCSATSFRQKRCMAQKKK